MADESYSFSTARARLEDIVTQVRKKDTSLEKSLDLLEEGVKLANACTELIDQQDWTSASAVAPVAEDSAVDEAVGEIVVDGVAVIEDVIVTDEDGTFVAEIIEVSEFEPVADEDDGAEDAWADEDGTQVAEQPDEPSADEG